MNTRARTGSHVCAITHGGGGNVGEELNSKQILYQRWNFDDSESGYGGEKVNCKNRPRCNTHSTSSSSSDSVLSREMTAVICMGVCRVRDGGGEKRGKKREFRGNWRVNETRGRKIYVRWRKQKEMATRKRSRDGGKAGGEGKRKFLINAGASSPLMSCDCVVVAKGWLWGRDLRGKGYSRVLLHPVGRGEASSGTGKTSTSDTAQVTTFLVRFPPTAPR